MTCECIGYIAGSVPRAQQGMNDEKQGQRRLWLPFVVVVVWFFLVGLLALSVWPNLPRSKFLFIALGPPLYLLGEGFFGWLFSEKHGRAISQSKFSGARILIALVVILAFLFILYGLPLLLAIP